MSLTHRACPAVAGRMLPAHGIGGRADLPLPGEVVLQAGGFVVLVSFLAVGLLWRRPKFGGEGREISLPPAFQRLADSTALRAILRWAALALLAYLLVTAFAGPPQINVNPAPRALYVLAWVGVVPASLLLGPVWRVLNPLRALHAAVLAIRMRLTPPAGPDPDADPSPSGRTAALEKLGYWPAAVGLAAFVWLELVPADRADPVVVGWFLLAYIVLVTAGALVFGAQWFQRGDPFEVYSTLIAGLAPVGRAADGTVVLRNPLRGLVAIAAAPGLIAVLAVWWGSTVFDGVSGTTTWINWSSSVHGGPASSTAVLLALCAIAGVSYRIATGSMAGSLVTTLIPIAVGYSIAHYASLLLIEGPRGLGLLVGATVTAPRPAPLLIAVIQVTAILVGHVAGVVAAHDRVLVLTADRSTAGRRIADQVPLVLIMIVYTMVGLYLLVIA